MYILLVTFKTGRMSAAQLAFETIFMQMHVCVRKCMCVHPQGY